VALARAVELLKSKDGSGTAVVVSAEHSQEDNIALLWFAREVLRTNQIYASGRPAGKGDNVLLNPDRNANTAGLLQLREGAPIRPFSDLETAAAAGKLDVVLALGASVPGAEVKAPKAARTLISLTSHEGPWAAAAAVVLPVSTWAEAEGTFVNSQNMAQVSQKAISPQGDSRPAWRVIAELAAAFARAPSWTRSEDVRGALSNATRTSSAPAASAGANG
jgi:NADH-quinone oxidoreductase subunit G